MAERYLAGKDPEDPLTLGALEEPARELPPAAVLGLGCDAALYKFNGESVEVRTSNGKPWLVVLAQKMPRKEGMRNARHHN